MSSMLKSPSLSGTTNESISTLHLDITTQGPLYPPSETVDKNGDFVVIGMIPKAEGVAWGAAIVDKNSSLPLFGKLEPYQIKLDLTNATREELAEIELFTLPLPLPLNNYPLVFAPEQMPHANKVKRPSYPLGQGYVADYRESDGLREIPNVNLADWMEAKGELEVTLSEDQKKARFDFVFEKMLPNSMYTIMSLRQKDLDPESPTRPGPLGIPNVFITDAEGNAEYHAELKNPFPDAAQHDSNRVINVVVLYMSCHQSYGGAIGLFGLGGDIHAHLKFTEDRFKHLTSVN